MTLDVKRPPRANTKYGLHYNRSFLTLEKKSEVLSYLASIYPIWEERYSKHNPPPEGQAQRWLLRPVYWLGNWQFACLDYYHPPRGVLNRCVRAEPFPRVFQEVVKKIETKAQEMFRPNDLPPGWELNTCLINFYGDRVDQATGNRVDCARVGEHKDFEPGPVGSVSIGERALFQFVSSKRVGERDGVIWQGWLDDGSLQIFGGSLWKDTYFHRVQRVERKTGVSLPTPGVEGFETRRINLTFRYVPRDHFVDFKDLPPELADDIRPYIDQLAVHSRYFREISR